MKKICAFVLIVALTIGLVACSENKKENIYLGEWQFEMSGDEQGELWECDVILRENGTCKVVYTGSYDGTPEYGYSVETDYRIVESVSNLQTDLIEELEYDPDMICTFVYNSNTDRLGTTFDGGAYISFVRPETEETSKMFEAAEDLAWYLDGSEISSCFETKWRLVFPDEYVDGEGITGQVEFEFHDDRSFDSTAKFYGQTGEIIEIEEWSGAYRIVEDSTQLYDLSDLVDDEYGQYVVLPFMYDNKTDRLGALWDVETYVSFVKEGSEETSQFFGTPEELNQYIAGN